MKLVRFRDTTDEFNEWAYGILVEDEDNDFGYGGDFVVCLCCLGIVENGEFEILEEFDTYPIDIDRLLKKELGE